MSRFGRMNSALALLRSLAERDPEHLLLQIDRETVTRGELLARVAECSAALVKHGVCPGDNIALVMPNSIWWCVLFWSVVNVGAIPVPLDPQTGAWELRNLTQLVPVKMWFVVPRFRTADIAGSIASLAAPDPGSPSVVSVQGEGAGVVPISRFLERAVGTSRLAVPDRAPGANDPLMLACTSGTTGNPKLIVVPHQGFVAAQCDMAGVLGVSPEDRMLLGMPLYHQGGFGMGLQALLSGASAHYRSVFEPEEFLDVIERERITVVQLSATLAKVLLSSPGLGARDLASVRLAYFAGEALPDEVARELWERRGIRVVNIIGSSETGTMAMWDSTRDAQHPPSDFLELPFTRVLVAGGQHDDGRRGVEAAAGVCGNLWVSTDALLTEYLGNERESATRLAARDGRRWFDTQDVVVRLPNSRIRFVGRAKRVIKRGANLIHPEEIEAFLLTHPNVAAVAVQAARHPLFGQAIVAHVQPAPGVTLQHGALFAFCRGKIAAYKIPDRFEIVDRLPVDIGKIQYKHLRSP